MPIQMIARELYKLEQEVEMLETRLESGNLSEREALREELAKVRAERDRMRKMLDAEKTAPLCRPVR